MAYYMNGRGIMAKTEELCDRMWDTLGAAIIGVSVIAGSIVLTLVGLATNFWPIIIVSIGLAACGYFLLDPWLKARRDVIRHRKAMAAETAKHGKGWAQS